MTLDDDKKATEPAKTEDAAKAETAKSEDVAKAKRLRQDSKRTGEDVPVSEDDKDAAKTKGKTDGKAESDDAAKTKGKADGKAGDDAVQAKGKADGEADDVEEFVSPEDASKTKWEARVRAERHVAKDDVHDRADGRSVGIPKARIKFEIPSGKPLMAKAKAKPKAQVPISPEMKRIIDDEDERKVQERMNRTEVRRQLNFQEDEIDDDDYAEVERQEAIRYQRRMEHLMQVDQEIQRKI